MKQKENIKYLNFIFIIIIMGICFINRDFLLKIPARLGIGSAGYDYAFGLFESNDMLPGENEDGLTLSGNSVSENDAGQVGSMIGEAQQEGTHPDKIEPAVSWEYITVQEDWFDDAVFIGDSRTVGLSEYAELSNTTFYASTGLNIYKLFDAKIIPIEGSREKGTIEEALLTNQFAKIYLMIGINEMGTGTVDTFMVKYKEAVAHLQELQPNAIIYLQAIMRVSTERSEQGDYINNQGIDARNAEIAKLADNNKIFYLDVNPFICDESNGLTKDYTFDGVHLKAKYISIWKQFLMEHAVIYK